MNDLLWSGLFFSLVALGSTKKFGLYDDASTPYRSYPTSLINQGINSGPSGHLYVNSRKPPPYQKRRPLRKEHWSMFSNKAQNTVRRSSPDCKCGRKPPEEKANAKFRVVGGNVGKYKRPWLTYLLVTSKKPEQSQVQFECGGTLINYQYILTAAHCICKLTKEERKVDQFCLLDNHIIHVASDAVKTMKALIGENHKTLIKKYGREIDLYIIHEEWFSHHDQHYDIALVRLKHRIKKFTNRMQPLCLPSSPRILKASQGKPYRIVFSNVCIVAGFGHVGYLSKQKVQCQTDHRLPRPFHTCKSECFKTKTPSFREPLCQDIAQKFGKHDYEQNFNGERGAVTIWDRKANNKTSCFAFDAGATGWCNVFPNFRSDKLFAEFSNSTWGYCGENFCQSHLKQKHTTKKLQEIELSLIRPKECEEILKAVETKDKSKKVFNRNEFCAGRKHRIRVFNYAIHGSRNQVSEQGGSHISFIGGGDTCAGDSGSGIWQWVKKPSSNTYYGVAIGIVSRGYGCAFVNRPGIYISVPSLLHWIHAYAKDGGCIPS